LYIFGGVFESLFYNDVFVVDLESRACRKLATTGDAPSARNTPNLGFWNGELIVWGGYDGHWPSSLHSLNLETMVWTSHEQSIPGKTGTTYAVIGNLLYCYASQASGGLVVVDMAGKSVRQAQTSGVEPPEGVVSSGMVAVEDRLFLVGGKGEGDFSLVYGCDVRQLVWSVFDIVPDFHTVAIADGRISPDGFFQIPRLASMGIVYDQKGRRIVSFLGRPMDSPTAIHVFHMEDALAIIHLQSDMVDAFNWAGRPSGGKGAV
jgi:hypothetical protein